MQITEPGRIIDNVYMIANPFMPIYLVKGTKLNIIIDSGVSALGSIYLEYIKSYLGSSNVKTYNLFTHSHYDHIGSAPYLKKHIPNLKTGGYFLIEQVLKSENAVKLITSLNKDMEKMMGVSFEDMSFKPFSLDIKLNGGEVFDTGNDTLEAIYTPGHTRDSMCYYLRGPKIMFTGEEAGVLEPGGKILPEFLTSYKLYIQSLNKIRQYPVDYIAVAHGGIIAGKQARHFFDDSLNETNNFIERIKRYYNEYENVDAVVERIHKEDYISSGISQPERAYFINLQAKVKAVVENK
ncbi:MAG: MBL fold metallo-hydrolase [Deltaproteobacteria bacterium]|nr:MBL fold metallo-hydrolase [Deltaproteobacteria bacterium]